MREYDEEILEGKVSFVIARLHWIIIKQLKTFQMAIKVMAIGLNIRPPRNVAKGRARIPFPIDSFAILTAAPNAELPPSIPKAACWNSLPVIVWIQLL